MAKKAIAGETVQFTTRILRYNKQGEKTGWTYIDIPADVASQVAPGIRKTFRVKGMLDLQKIEGIALLPVGKGNFIMPLNAVLRKRIGKRHGAMLYVKISFDPKEPQLNKDLMICLKEEPNALAFFQKLTKSHQMYFSKWIDSAKTTETKARRIARIVNALLRKMDYGQMLREKI